jgi:hypothetical protein
MKPSRTRHRLTHPNCILLMLLVALPLVALPTKIQADDGYFDNLYIGGGNFTIDSSGNSTFSGTLLGMNVIANTITTNSLSGTGFNLTSATVTNSGFSGAFLEGFQGISLQADAGPGGINLTAYDDGTNPGVVNINAYAVSFPNGGGGPPYTGSINLNASSYGTSNSSVITIGATGHNGTISLLADSDNTYGTGGNPSNIVLNSGYYSGITISTSGYISLNAPNLSPGLLGVDYDGQLVNVTISSLVGYNSGSNYLGLGSVTSPYYPLDVGGDARVSGTMTLGSLVTTSSATINGNFTTTGSASIANGQLTLRSLTNSATSATTYSAAAGSVINTYLTTDSSSNYQYLDLVSSGTNTTSGIIRLLTKPTTSNASPVERIRIDNAGNVGIGTASPSATLAVAGSGSFSGNLSVAGTLTISNGVATPWLFVSGLTSSVSTNYGGEIPFVTSEGYFRATPNFYYTTYNSYYGPGLYTNNINVISTNSNYGYGFNVFYSQDGVVGVGATLDCNSLLIQDENNFNGNGGGGWAQLDAWGDLYIGNDITGDVTLFAGQTGDWSDTYTGGNPNEQIVEVGVSSTTTFSTLFDVQNSTGSVFRVDTDNSMVGIRQPNPASVLSVNGNAAIGSYSTTAAPTNGLIVSGSVGVGTSSPATPLDVNGSATVRGTVRTRPGGGLSMGSFTYSSAGAP